jgi:hypothetical protein
MPIYEMTVKDWLALGLPRESVVIGSAPRRPSAQPADTATAAHEQPDAPPNGWRSPLT